MSVEQLALVLNHAKAKGTAKVVLIGIANHDGDGGAWPSITTLARYANVSRSNVQEAIARLVRDGLLLVEYQEGGDLRTPRSERPNRYHILVTCPEQCDRTAQHRILCPADCALPHRHVRPRPTPALLTGRGAVDNQGDPALLAGPPPALKTGPEPPSKPAMAKGPKSATDRACPRVRAGKRHLLDEQGFCIACLIDPATGRSIA